MYVVIAEATSDIDCLKILIRRLANNKSISIEGKGSGFFKNWLGHSL